MTKAERPSPIVRMTIMADHLEKSAADPRNVVVARTPLYASLNDSQKGVFGRWCASSSRAADANRSAGAARQISARCPLCAGSGPTIVPMKLLLKGVVECDQRVP